MLPRAFFFIVNYCSIEKERMKNVAATVIWGQDSDLNRNSYIKSIYKVTA